jgi:CubicO group peptidase (beta-lactamase class C family)
MKDTSFVPTAEQLKRIAKAYDAEKTGLREVPIGQLKYPLDDPDRQPMPAGGLFSTAADMARFYRMVANHGQLEGARIISEQTLALMTKKQTADAVKQPNGLGFAVGGGKIGHGGAMGTNSQYDPATGLISIYLVQQGKMTDETKKIQPAFHRAVAELYGKQPTNQPKGEKAKVSAN